MNDNKKQSSNYFSHSLKNDYIMRLGAKVWLLDEAYTPKSEWFKEPFNKKFYAGHQENLLYFQWIADQFLCANPHCLSEDVVCIWYEYNGIDMGVDETYGEFYCEKCGKYTFVDYYRDSS